MGLPPPTPTAHPLGTSLQPVAPSLGVHKPRMEHGGKLTVATPLPSTQRRPPGAPCPRVPNVSKPRQAGTELLGGTEPPHTLPGGLWGRPRCALQIRDMQMSPGSSYKSGAEPAPRRTSGVGGPAAPRQVGASSRGTPLCSWGG